MTKATDEAHRTEEERSPSGSEVAEPDRPADVVRDIRDLQEEPGTGALQRVLLWEV